MIAGILALAMLIIKLFPETPTARVLMLYLVELPMRAAQKLERRHIILLAVVICAGQSLVLLGSAELALAYALDMSAYYDLLIVAWTAAAATRAKAAWIAVRMVLPRPSVIRSLARPRSSRRSAATTSCQQADNDEDDIGLLIAA